MKLRFSQQRNHALTLTEVLVVIFVIAFAVALLLPALAAAKKKHARINCISNLKQIGIAFRIWEGDHGDKFPMAVSVTNGGAMEMIVASNAYVLWQTMSNQLSSPKILWCPADTNTFPATNFSAGFSDANISYFLNLYADEMYPQMIMDGDDNLLVDGKRVQPGILNLWTNQTIAWTKDRHHGVGNIGFADGHADQVTSHGLNATVVGSVATNRWLIP
jgi:prepilin-type processing-associated H-X9-DG protein